MEFEYSKKTKMYMEQLTDFMNKHVYPAEAVFAEQLNQGPTRWQVPPIMEELKAKARERGLWNLFLPESERGAGLDQPRVRAALRDHGPLAHRRRRSFNCSAPGHRQHGGARALRHARAQEAVARAAARGQDPLRLRHDRSPRWRRRTPPTSSRASRATATHYVINGHKWWTSGIGDPRCKVLIFMGKTGREEPGQVQAAVR